jgi:hypothetical protein
MGRVSLTPAERSDLLARYRGGHALVVAALDGITDDELDRVPPDGGWTARQVCHHLADSELTSAIRVRRLLAEDDAVIHGYDEEAFAARLHYERPIGPSLEAFRLARETTAAILDRLDDADWERSGTHTESGPYGVETWLAIYADHGEDHAAQIRAARA